MSDFCTNVELNSQAIRELQKECGSECRAVAEKVAKGFGKGATVRVSYATGRPHAFVNAPYEEASEDNKLLKSVRKVK